MAYRLAVSISAMAEHAEGAGAEIVFEMDDPKLEVEGKGRPRERGHLAIRPAMG